MDISEILTEASNEIIYQTSDENDAAAMFAEGGRPFPLSGYFTPDDTGDFIRLFKGRDDFRGLRGFIRNHAADLFCRCVSEFCEKHGIESPDLSQMEKAFYNGMRDMALRQARDVVEYDMDDKRFAQFWHYHGKQAQERGMFRLYAAHDGENGAVTLTIGDDVWKLAEGPVKKPSDMAKLLSEAFPAIADMLPVEKDAEKKDRKPKA